MFSQNTAVVGMFVAWLPALDFSLYMLIGNTD